MSGKRFATKVGQKADARAQGHFVARERELARLGAFLDQPVAGKGTVSFVAGGAGTGKTALMAQFARRAQHARDGLVVAVGNCSAQSGIGDPCLPFRGILGLLTGGVEAKLEQEAISKKNGRRLRRLAVRAGQVLIQVATA